MQSLVPRLRRVHIHVQVLVLIRKLRRVRLTRQHRQVRTRAAGRLRLINHTHKHTRARLRQVQRAVSIVFRCNYAIGLSNRLLNYNNHVHRQDSNSVGTFTIDVIHHVNYDLHVRAADRLPQHSSTVTLNPLSVIHGTLTARHGQVKSDQVLPLATVVTANSAILHAKHVLNARVTRAIRTGTRGTLNRTFLANFATDTVLVVHHVTRSDADHANLLRHNDTVRGRRTSTIA